MKRIIFTGLIVMVISLIFPSVCSKTIAHADDSAILDVRVEVVSASDAISYNQIIANSAQTNAMAIQANDYKVSICITNNPGYSSSGMTVSYGGDYFDILTYEKENGLGPVYIQGIAAPNVLIASYSSHIENNQTVYYAGIATIGTANNSSDGNIVSFFFRKKPNTSQSQVSNLVKSLNIVQICEHDNYGAPISYINNSSNADSSNGFYLMSQLYLCGDIDNDGDVDAMDAQLLNNLLQTQSSSNYTISTLDLDGTYSITDAYGTHTFDKIMIVTAANTDGNDIIDINDALAILDYYSNHIVNSNPYNGIIGTYVTGYIFVPFSSTP